jgi:hypothetical protein
MTTTTSRNQRRQQQQVIPSFLPSARPSDLPSFCPSFRPYFLTYFLTSFTSPSFVFPFIVLPSSSFLPSPSFVSSFIFIPSSSFLPSSLSPPPASDAEDADNSATSEFEAGGSDAEAVEAKDDEEDAYDDDADDLSDIVRSSDDDSSDEDCLADDGGGEDDTGPSVLWSSSASVEVPDEEATDVPAFQIRAGESRHAVGDRVEGRFDNDEWYPGEIAKVRSDGRYDIQFDDGDFEKKVHKTDVRKDGKAQNEVVDVSEEDSDGGAGNTNGGVDTQGAIDMTSTVPAVEAKPAAKGDFHAVAATTATTKTEPKPSKKKKSGGSARANTAPRSRRTITTADGGRVLMDDPAEKQPTHMDQVSTLINDMQAAQVPVEPAVKRVKREEINMDSGSTNAPTKSAPGGVSCELRTSAAAAGDVLQCKDGPLRVTTGQAKVIHATFTSLATLSVEEVLKLLPLICRDVPDDEVTLQCQDGPLKVTKEQAELVNATFDSLESLPADAVLALLPMIKPKPKANDGNSTTEMEFSMMD